MEEYTLSYYERQSFTINTPIIKKWWQLFSKQKYESITHSVFVRKTSTIQTDNNAVEYFNHSLFREYLQGLGSDVSCLQLEEGNPMTEYVKTSNIENLATNYIKNSDLK